MQKIDNRMNTMNNNFLISALTEENPFITTSQAIQWIMERNNSIKVSVEKIPFSKLKGWKFNFEKGILMHESGKFFSIVGIHVKTNWGKISEWKQPIILQSEIGYLGIITKKINGILYFLLQAKVEPGNVNNVQLSPTLQATRSNYTQVHNGKKPLYLEYFQNACKDQIVIDQLQSEQGARFMKKRNRNIILTLEENIPVYDNFIWLTLGQIKKLMLVDNLVNMDTRTVISSISFETNDFSELLLDVLPLINSKDVNVDFLQSAINKSFQLNTFDEIIKWLSSLKCKYDLEVHQISLFEVDSWTITEDNIHHKENTYFKVIATKVEIDNREVQSWYQPLIEPRQEGLIAFIFKKINGVIHFLIQAKLESGNFDILEMAPTVQCLTGSYRNSNDLPFLEYVLNAKEKQIVIDTLQSEEGGRFYKEQNRNILIEADASFPANIPENYIWITLNQLQMFLKFNNYLNIQCRSLIALINYLK
jgi:oxidase EvaA